jgi:hypothetical protein
LPTLLYSAAHVFQPQQQYTIVTSDNQPHPILKSSIKPLPNVDLAITQFTSNQNYPIAQLENSAQLTRNSPFYISGYTATKNTPSSEADKSKPTPLTKSGPIVSRSKESKLIRRNA